MKILNWIKTFIITALFKNILLGALLGACVGIGIIIVSEYIGYPVMDLIHNVAPWFLVEYWYICWTVAGIIAKILPW